MADSPRPADAEGEDTAEVQDAVEENARRAAE
jgi:hypothetical protein